MQSDLIAELQRLESARPGGDIPPGPFTGYVTRRWFDLLNDAPVWQQVAIHPGVLAVLVKILGDGFLLSTLGTAVIGPGEKAQPLHVDDTVYAFPRPHPNLVCNTMWAIDATINYCNGSMRQQENLMLGIHPDRLMTFSAELQDLLGFRMCKGAGHLSATDPRQELERRYGTGNSP